MNRAVIISVFLLIACTGTAWAQTPDGETPSEETDCDGLPGPLFGLCNAYCEAMDCDTGANANDRACERVLANYHRQSGGVDPPCIQSADCCEPSSVSGCDDGVCEAEVCSIEPMCCIGTWDAFCALMAEEVCTACGAGDPPPPPAP